MKNRVSNPVIPNYAPKAKVVEPTIKLEPCVECHKPILDGYYGRWGDGGVCSKTCDILHMQKRKGE
jgi:hypothetical protein